MDINQSNGVYHLSGRMDEFADFEPLRSAASPLKLNLGKISSLNSMGVRRFLTFIIAWNPRKLEFYECTSEFIGNVNVIPQMTGKDPAGDTIKSLYVPFYCATCQRTESELWDRDQIHTDSSGEVIVPKKVCGKCGEEMALDGEPSEYFIFMRRPQGAG